jgi:hypothetical protein
MKKSSQVALTVVAAIGLARAQSAADPCEASVFNEHACQEAVRQHGYCQNGGWVRLRYSYPYPYYYDRYQVYATLVGPPQAAVVDSCRVPSGGTGAHVPAFRAVRAGFGSSGCHHAGG